MLEHLATVIAMSASPALLQVSRAGTDEPLTVTAELAGPPVHGGCLTRIDPAEPAAQIVTGVLTGSPAQRAGLVVGDRLLAAPWIERDAHAPAAGPEELVIERRGRILRAALPPAIATDGAGARGRAVSLP
jgi:hypothetical protein